MGLIHFFTLNYMRESVYEGVFTSSVGVFSNGGRAAMVGGNHQGKLDF